MSNLHTLTARVSALEDKLADVAHRATTAHSLALGSRVSTRVLHALRETQLEHGERLDRLEREMRHGFADFDRRMRHGFAMTAAGMERIAELIAQREKQDD